MERLPFCVLCFFVWRLFSSVFTCHWFLTLFSFIHYFCGCFHLNHRHFIWPRSVFFVLKLYYVILKAVPLLLVYPFYCVVLFPALSLLPTFLLHYYIFLYVQFFLLSFSYNLIRSVSLVCKFCKYEALPPSLSVRFDVTTAISAAGTLCRDVTCSSVDRGWSCGLILCFSLQTTTRTTVPWRFQQQVSQKHWHLYQSTRSHVPEHCNTLFVCCTFTRASH